MVSIKTSTEGHGTGREHDLGNEDEHLALKYVIVVDEDIDPWNSEQVNWSIAWRARLGKDIKIWPRHKGSRLDPSVPPEEKGFEDRVLIDAIRPDEWARVKFGQRWHRQGYFPEFPLDPTAVRCGAQC